MTALSLSTRGTSPGPHCRPLNCFFKFETSSLFLAPKQTSRFRSRSHSIQKRRVIESLVIKTFCKCHLSAAPLLTLAAFLQRSGRAAIIVKRWKG
jgi:hypothetical protein